MQLKTLLRDKHTRLTQDLQQKALWGASYMALLFSFWITSRGSRLMIKTLLHWCRSFAIFPIATGLWFQLPYRQFNPKLTSLRRRFLFGQALKAQWCIDGIHLFSIHLERYLIQIWYLPESLLHWTDMEPALRKNQLLKQLWLCHFVMKLHKHWNITSSLV